MPVLGAVEGVEGEAVGLGGEPEKIVDRPTVGGAFPDKALGGEKVEVVGQAEVGRAAIAGVGKDSVAESIGVGAGAIELVERIEGIQQGAVAIGDGGGIDEPDGVAIDIQRNRGGVGRARTVFNRVDEGVGDGLIASLGSVGKRAIGRDGNRTALRRDEGADRIAGSAADEGDAAFRIAVVGEEAIGRVHLDADIGLDGVAVGGGVGGIILGGDRDGGGRGFRGAVHIRDFDGDGSVGGVRRIVGIGILHLLDGRLIVGGGSAATEGNHVGSSASCDDSSGQRAGNVESFASIALTVGEGDDGLVEIDAGRGDRDIGVRHTDGATSGGGAIFGERSDKVISASRAVIGIQIQDSARRSRQRWRPPCCRRRCHRWRRR